MWNIDPIFARMHTHTHTHMQKHANKYRIKTQTYQINTAIHTSHNPKICTTTFLALQDYLRAVSVENFSSRPSLWNGLSRGSSRPLEVVFFPLFVVVSSKWFPLFRNKIGDSSANDFCAHQNHPAPSLSSCLNANTLLSNIFPPSRRGKELRRYCGEERVCGNRDFRR